MKDVASRAGVALKTVSRVVNGEPGVTAETTQRVLGAIEDLGFRRNESARLLRTGHTATVGFIADNCADPEQAALFRGLEEVARDHGFLFYSGSTDSDPTREERLALTMCARRVDGLVVVPTPADHGYLEAEIRAGVATVFALRPPALVTADAVLARAGLAEAELADGVPADVVLADERGGARAAVRHLIAHGHRRIGYLSGDPSGYRSRQLLRGYGDAMAAAGLPVEGWWTSLTPRQLIDPPGRPVTGVFCAGREDTALALRALGSSRERRVALVGFGDFELADLMAPGITVVSYDPVQAGRTAGDLLVRRLAGATGPARRVELPTRLIPRGSAEFGPGG